MPADGERGRYSNAVYQVEHRVTAVEKMGEAGSFMILFLLLIWVAAMPSTHQSANNQ